MNKSRILDTPSCNLHALVLLLYYAILSRLELESHLKTFYIHYDGEYVRNWVTLMQISVHVLSIAFHFDRTQLPLRLIRAH